LRWCSTQAICSHNKTSFQGERSSARTNLYRAMNRIRLRPCRQE
jgi:hypothetical protein